ncbi:CBS domain-containing protein [Spirosomataceae bacterium TFI 002]|nr:CBS domain-containing protein [Spirosomataceae bacterium TFI 002]
MKNFQNKAIDVADYNDQSAMPKVTEYMTPVKRLITVKEDSPILQALSKLLDKKITGVPVLNDAGEVVGLLDDKDCLNILLGGTYYNHPVAQDKVSAYMSNVMKSISIDTDIFKVTNIFLTTPYKRLIVMDHDGKLAGQISRRDILRAIWDMNKNLV